MLMVSALMMRTDMLAAMRADVCLILPPFFADAPDAICALRERRDVAL